MVRDDTDTSHKITALALFAVTHRTRGDMAYFAGHKMDMIFVKYFWF